MKVGMGKGRPGAPVFGVWNGCCSIRETPEVGERRPQAPNGAGFTGEETTRSMQVFAKNKVKNTEALYGLTVLIALAFTTYGFSSPITTNGFSTTMVNPFSGTRTTRTLVWSSRGVTLAVALDGLGSEGIDWAATSDGAGTRTITATN